MTTPGPVDTAPLFAPLHDELIALLRSLDPDEWLRPTVAGRWRVREVAAHLLDGDLRHVAVHRDGHVLPIEQPIASARDGRQYDVTAAWTTGCDQLMQVMNPRLLRLGIRWNF